MSGMSHFMRDRSGSSAVEFALIVLLFFGVIFAVIDMSRALWAWNTAGKATQLGARLAVVENFAAQGLQNYDGVADAGGNGLSVPISAISPNPVVCTSSGCNGYGPLDASFTTIATRMQNVYSAIQPTNVVIEYQHIGLGFSGNPYGSDIAPVVTVKLQNLTFNLITPILSGFVSLAMPDFAVSLTAESMGS
jgi:Flp pilus assembly protein TadG